MVGAVVEALSPTAPFSVNLRAAEWERIGEGVRGDDVVLLASALAVEHANAKRKGSTQRYDTDMKESANPL